MVRLGLAACVVAVTAGAAHAGELPRAPGMYMPNGVSLALVESKVEVVVRGPIVEAVVTQKFVNRTAKPTEATYVFPLPFDAAVSAMAIESGNRKIHASIEKREQAQQRYEQAVRAGVAGALLDQERPDVFTQTVAAVPARGTVAVSLRFDTTARYQDGVWELVLPLVVAPRYVPGVATNRPTTGTGRAPDTDRAPDASRVTPGGSPGAGGPTTVTIKFADKPNGLTCPTHELKVAPSGEATFTDPKTDHDAVLRWKTPATAAGWVEQDADGGYAAVVVEAPAAGPRSRAVRWMLVLDRSAASRGDADAVAKPLVRGLFGAMKVNDRVAVTGSDTFPWGTGPDVARAIEQVWQRNPGPFDLTKVLARARPDGSPLVLVSGGLVADDKAAIAAASRLGVPIHVIGVGPAPARALLMQLATATGGTARFALPGDDVLALARAALADVATPPLPLSVTWGTLAASEVVPGALPRLGAGQATLVLARVKRAQTANGRARGELFAIEALPGMRARDGATTAMGPLARRWARNRLDEMIAGRAAAAVITSHALKYGLVSPYTSMVAVGGEVVVQGGVKRSVAIPVSVPAGMKWQMVKKETTVDNRNEADPNKRSPVVTKGDKKPTKTLDRGGGGYTKNVPRPQVEPRRRPAAKQPRKPKDRVAVKESAPPPPPKQAPSQPTAPVEATGGAVAPDTDDEHLKRSAKKKRNRADDDSASDGDDEDLRDHEHQPLAPRTMAAVGSADSYAEAVLTVGGTRRKWRFAASISGGFARSGGESVSLLAPGARLEFALAPRVLAGIDASLWLLDAETVRGQALASFAVLGIQRWLELGLGVGLSFGEQGAGPATGVSLRFHLPPKPRAALFLRYDGALLYDNDARRGQSSGTFGFEWGF